MKQTNKKAQNEENKKKKTTQHKQLGKNIHMTQFIIQIVSEHIFSISISTLKTKGLQFFKNLLGLLPKLTRMAATSK